MTASPFAILLTRMSTRDLKILGSALALDKADGERRRDRETVTFCRGRLMLIARELGRRARGMTARG